MLKKNKQLLEEVLYNKALNEVMKVHIERKQKYGDSWKNNQEYQFMGLVKEKADRLERNFLCNNNSYERKVDTLIDLINWSLFYLTSELNKYETISKTTKQNYKRRKHTKR